ncbi:hypothetical protein CVT25_006484 [Psilocybe cyanescens]|uniref:Transcriptional regulatory protein n=1 Tax=Psilocybe cyanescens TaxID=93625 RepID=A0A409XEB0_PSICY|nr:hypothetical protein CVT25_006484 [Psilocybe cyanescens]
MFTLLVRSPRSLSLTRSFLTYHALRSGHNKWSKIKDKKGANDAQKSVLYTRMNRFNSGKRVLYSAVGGSLDPEKNAMLATTLKKAREQGVPKDNIEKALANCARSKEHTGERVVYEALAFKSVGIIMQVLECVTDNINRTIHNVREILTSHGAHMTPVNFMFDRVGCVTVNVVDKTGEFSKFEELMIASDVKDIKDDRSPSDPERVTVTFRVYCDPSQLAALQGLIEQSKDEINATIQSAELTYVPVDNTLADSELEEQVQELVQDLEDIDDIAKVWTSLD